MGSHKPKLKDKYHYQLDTPEMIQACLNCPYAECKSKIRICNRLKKVKEGDYRMTLNEYAEQAQRTSNCTQYRTKLINGAMGLCGEAGEVIDLIKKWVYQGHDLDRQRIAVELGDTIWYAAEIAKGLGIPLETICKMNIEKLEKRYPNGFDAERSRNREENDG